MIKLIPHPLTKEAFAPYGQVIDMDEQDSFLINEGTTRRFDAIAQIDVAAENGVPVLSIFRAEKRNFPFVIQMLERHPLGSQTFLPMQDYDWLVVVARGETPSVETCEVFIAKGNQGVQYSAGTWHHPLLIYKPNQDFWVIDRRGEGDNLQEHWFEGILAEIDI